MSDQKTVMKEMLANAVHFGHKSEKWNPKMAPYLYTKKNGVHIFDLNQTYQGMQKASEFLKFAASQGKNILFVSTKQQSSALVEAEAKKCGMPYVNSRWIPGLLTNFKTIRARVRYLQKLKEQEESGDLEKYTKKEALNFRKEIMKLEAALGGVMNLENRPDILFVVDVVRDNIAVKEAKKVGLTVVGIVDSNADPDDVDYPIPGNDDAIKSISYLVTQLSEVIQDGLKSRKK